MINKSLLQAPNSSLDPSIYSPQVEINAKFLILKFLTRALNLKTGIDALGAF